MVDVTLNWERNKKCIHNFGSRLLRKLRKEFCDDMKTDFRIHTHTDSRIAVGCDM